jgi:electron transfer flavoprotein alpha subunit
MKCNIVVNGFSVEYAKSLGELAGFMQTIDAPWDGAFLLCPKAADYHALAEPIPLKKITVLQMDAYIPETALNALVPRMNGGDMYIFEGNFSGHELAIRSAIRKGGSSLTGVSGLRFDRGRPAADKRLYSHCMEGSFRMNRPPYCVSIAKGLFEKDSITARSTAGEKEIQVVSIAADRDSPVRINEIIPPEIKASLGDAKLLLVAGRGTGSKAAVDELEKAAQTLGGAFGVSRPVAMNAWASLDTLIGVSGCMAKPDLCIALAVSGSAAFYAGIERSGFIVAVNTDEDAPIMKMADVAVQGDYRSVLDALLQLHKGEGR